MFSVKVITINESFILNQLQFLFLCVGQTNNLFKDFPFLCLNLSLAAFPGIQKELNGDCKEADAARGQS